MAELGAVLCTVYGAPSQRASTFPPLSLSNLDRSGQISPAPLCGLHDAKEIAVSRRVLRAVGLQR
jgi:hypothetical protein